jgi:hypothetical protein
VRLRLPDRINRIAQTIPTQQAAPKIGRLKNSRPGLELQNNNNNDTTPTTMLDARVISVPRLLFAGGGGPDCIGEVSSASDTPIQIAVWVPPSKGPLNRLCVPLRPVSAFARGCGYPAARVSPSLLTRSPNQALVLHAFINRRSPVQIRQLAPAGLCLSVAHRARSQDP